MTTQPDRKEDLIGVLAGLLRGLEEAGEVSVLQYADYSDPAEVRRLLRARRRRDYFFNPSLFGEPAWDILLELYASHLEKRSICVSALCAASAVPSTTALRWIRILENEGLIERVANERDKRVFFLKMTAAGLTRMKGFFHLVPIEGDDSGFENLPRLPRMMAP